MPSSIELKAIGAVVGPAVHDINNALSTIQYSFLLIKDAIPAEHPQYSSVEAIERGISRIAAVTRQLYEAYPHEKEAPPDASLARDEVRT